jgi:hypothetical protein
MRLFFEGLHFNLFSFDLCERISMIQGVTGKSAFILTGNRTQLQINISKFFFFSKTNSEGF